MPLKLVEQVGTVGHPIANGPAEDLVEGAAGGLPLQVEECDFEGGERRRTRLVALRGIGAPGVGIASDGRIDPLREAVEIDWVEPYQGDP